MNDVDFDRDSRWREPRHPTRAQRISGSPLVNDYADLEKRLRECVDPKQPTYGEALRAEAADALASLTRELEAERAEIATMKERLEQECDVARIRGDKESAFILEGGYRACEALIDLSVARKLSAKGKTDGHN